jgi:hypothetical protein
MKNQTSDQLTIADVAAIAGVTVELAETRLQASRHPVENPLPGIVARAEAQRAADRAAEEVEGHKRWLEREKREAHNRTVEQANARARGLVTV